MNRITRCELAEWQAAGRRFTLLDVRRAAARAADAAEIPGARWLDPESVFSWKDSVPRDRPVLLYCAHGHEISQGIAATLVVRNARPRPTTGRLRCKAASLVHGISDSMAVVIAT